MTVPTLSGQAPDGATGTTARPGLGAQLLRRKPISQMVNEAENNNGGPAWSAASVSCS
jgi:basic amino acid/polyamine antiporter, APA family